MKTMFFAIATLTAALITSVAFADDMQAQANNNNTMQTPAQPMQMPADPQSQTNPGASNPAAVNNPNDMSAASAATAPNNN